MFVFFFLCLFCYWIRKKRCITLIIITKQEVIMAAITTTAEKALSLPLSFSRLWPQTRLNFDTHTHTHTASSLPN